MTYFVGSSRKQYTHNHTSHYHKHPLQASNTHILTLQNIINTQGAKAAASKQHALIYTTLAALYAKICPQNRTDFYPYGLNSTPIIADIFLRLHIASPRPLDRSLFAFVLCFLRQKIKKNFASPQLRFLDAIFMWQFSGRCRHRRLVKTAHDFAQLSTMVDFIDLSIKLVFMVLGVSYTWVLAQRPTGCCSASSHYDVSTPVHIMEQ